MPRNSLAAIALVLLAGCDTSVGNRTQRSGEPRVVTAETQDENSSQPLAGVGAPLAWRVVDGAAFYGAADHPPEFALRCDRANSQIVLERAGGGTALNLSAGGVGASLGTREVGEGRVQARTGMGDAVLDAMARPQAHIVVAGGAETLNIPGGVAVRRVLDFCRNPPAPPEPEPSPSDTDTPIANATSAPPLVLPPVPTPTR